MQHTMRKLAVAGAVAGGSVLTLAPSVYATTTGAHLSPASTVITGSLKSGTNLVFNGTVDGFPLTVTCTTLSASGKTPAAGLAVTLSKPPSFTGCTDSGGGTDTVTTKGTWKLVWNSTGTKVKLKIPLAGATFTSTLLAGCVITVAPTAAASIAGAYDNVNTWTINKASFPIAGNSACTTSPTATATATVVFTPNVSVVP